MSVHCALCYVAGSTKTRDKARAWRSPWLEGEANLEAFRPPREPLALPHAGRGQRDLSLSGARVKYCVALCYVGSRAVVSVSKKERVGLRDRTRTRAVRAARVPKVAVTAN